MNKIKKVIIPAAGWGTRFLPFTKQVPKELSPILTKPIIHYLVEEAYNSGIEEVIIITNKRKETMMDYFKDNKPLEEMLASKGKDELLKIANETKVPIKITIVYQEEQKGLAHALSMAKDHIDNEPFGVILGDDLIKSNVPVIKQLIEAYEQNPGTILGVQTVSDDSVHKYGVIEPLDSTNPNKKLVEVKGAVEKPKLEDAPSKKAMLGRYIFTPLAMELFSKLEQVGDNEINVVDIFTELLKTEKIYGFEFEGTRYDLGSAEGFVKANIDYALDNPAIKDSIKKFISEK